VIAYLPHIDLFPSPAMPSPQQRRVAASPPACRAGGAAAGRETGRRSSCPVGHHAMGNRLTAARSGREQDPPLAPPVMALSSTAGVWLIAEAAKDHLKAFFER
jgi:hypothetical protein